MLQLFQLVCPSSSRLPSTSNKLPSRVFIQLYENTCVVDGGLSTVAYIGLISIRMLYNTAYSSVEVDAVQYSCPLTIVLTIASQVLLTTAQYFI